MQRCYLVVILDLRGPSWAGRETRLGIDVSMGRKGNRWGNAVAEGVFATIKTHLLYDHRWASRLDLRAAVFDCIEVSTIASVFARRSATISHPVRDRPRRYRGLPSQRNRGTPVLLPMYPV